MLVPAFLMFCVSEFENAEERSPYKPGKSTSAEGRAFTLMSSVCWHWCQTLIGWSKSTTRSWLKIKMKKLTECEYIGLLPQYLLLFM